MIHVGTCSWTEKSLIKSGEWYPKTARTAEARLNYYASHFDTVEVDSTFYALPTKQNAYLWAQRSPEGFIFHVKVYGAMTGHAVDPRSLPPEILNELPAADRGQKYVYIKRPELLRTIFERFTDSLYPLISTGKLGVFVFQFPPWFTYKEKHLEYILSCKQHIGRNAIAVEFRHGSWYLPQVRDKVFHFLQKNKIIHVVADEPQFGTLATVPFVPQTTADVAYYRLHGRNKENWLKKNVETSLRYAYLYSDKELEDFVPHIQTSAKTATETYVMFNNCHGSFGVTNAEKMKELVKQSTR